MTYDDPRMKELAMIWKRAAPLLRAQRHRDIRRQNNADTIAAFDEYFNHWIKKKRPVKVSGLVEMYRVLGRQPKG
jgi:hypothetical protein